MNGVRAMYRFLALLLALVVATGARGEAITFAAQGERTRLLALLGPPDSPPPHSAVVLLHGCGGLWRGAEVKPIYRQWVARFRRAGHTTLLVDSAGPRGIRYSCGKRRARRTLYRGRPGTPMVRSPIFRRGQTSTPPASPSPAGPRAAASCC